MSAPGMIVCGCVTGTHILEDIKVAVPHQVAVPITPQQMVDSKDLYRALNSGAIFKLNGGHFHNPKTAPSKSNTVELTRALKENKELKRKLAEANQKNEGLQRALMGLNTQLDGILGAIGRLGPAPAAQPQATALPPGMMGLLQQLVAQGGAGVVQGVLPVNSDVVGGEAPVFFPTEIKPKDAETSIRVEKSEGSSVSDASKRLKELRKGKG